MKKISEQCGINFYYQESIKNSRIRGVTFKKDGKVFLYISDLFKCVERLWVSYIHELIHIMNNDLDKEEFRIEEYRKDNEDFIEDKTISFFINDYRNIKSCNIETVLKAAEENKIQKGIAAYLIRNITNVYDVSEVNELLHYY